LDSWRCYKPGGVLADFSKVKFSQPTCNVTSNSITGNSTVNLRKNAGNAGPALSIGANATGIFNDNTDTYTAAAMDAMNYQIVTGSTTAATVLLLP